MLQMSIKDLDSIKRDVRASISVLGARSPVCLSIRPFAHQVNFVVEKWKMLQLLHIVSLDPNATVKILIITAIIIVVIILWLFEVI